MIGSVSPARTTIKPLTWQCDVVGMAQSSIVLLSWVPFMIFLLMHYPQFHQPWRLYRASQPIMHCICSRVTCGIHSASPDASSGQPFRSQGHSRHDRAELHRNPMPPDGQSSGRTRLQQLPQFSPTLKITHSLYCYACGIHEHSIPLSLIMNIR